MKIVTLKEARAGKLPKYYTGKPCKRGHYSERTTNGRQCVECKRESGKADYKKNKEAHLEKNRRWYKENKERHAELVRRWYDKNTDRKAELSRNWYKENKVRVIERARVRRGAMASDPEYRMQRTMRNMVYSTVKRKTDRTHKLLGYNAVDLRSHIERQFTKGMSWDNYGEWHIDHVVSIAQLMREGETDPAKINCLSNLRPLWAKDNQTKKDKPELLI